MTAVVAVMSVQPTSAKRTFSHCCGSTEALAPNANELMASAVNVFASFAERMQRTCTINVKEAQQGDKLVAGCAYIAPGGLHLRICKQGSALHCQLDDGETVLNYCAVHFAQVTLRLLFLWSLALPRYLNLPHGCMQRVLICSLLNKYSI